MRGADYYWIEEGRVVCKLCPHECRLKERERGICGVREVRDGRFYTLNYGVISANNLDKIEKKPLYHYYSGKKIVSIGSFGCNFKCRFCQNHSIAQGDFTEVMTRSRKADSDRIVDYALEMRSQGNIGVAYTYNEPVIWYEYMLDIAKKVKSVGLKNVMVTNGYINKEPLLELIEYMDAFSVDLKSYDKDFYKEIIGGDLEVVKENLILIAKSGRHLEVDYLVVTGHNDKIDRFEELMKWYSDNLGRGVPLHINRYHPSYKMSGEKTPIELLIKMYEVAKKYLDHVYIGNINSDVGRDTLCPKCGKLLIDRSGVVVKNLRGNNCPNCKRRLEGEFVRVRRNIAEGRFYPSDAGEIENMFLDAMQYIELYRDLDNKKIVGGVVPHAGYEYCVKEALYFFKTLKAHEGRYDTVILLNPNHTGNGQKIEIDNNDAWSSPFGEEIIDSLLRENLGLAIGEEAQKYEHSGEVILPYIKYFLDQEIKILPICMIDQSYNTSKMLAKKLFETAMRLEKKPLVIASSDFTHFKSEKEGWELDSYALESITSLDSKEFYSRIREKDISICGLGPIMVLIEYLKLVGDSPKLEVLARGNSGRIGGKDEVVDYVSLLATIKK